ncbi:MAG: bifunctional DNA-formamidopyrimidine glycosylase/DNA-(apurinic or apyrimidinic site) lyase [Gammaproteobacteria bacterium]|nr:bifunctional DNA-formamidopyrimidine glycosylase/DNA-(apurinic or apyrimidinic site) lyase [Gammaproteobacteria bacterium]MCF6229371.1 bifunctional DNA-formamidopyrimidine glycosylase/DNA-(apurinic or apyrimidinic site) lyase [Gammaproteobacteria bacterium]
MPELPEVETVRRGITPHMEGERVKEVIIRHPTLRWPIPTELIQMLPEKRLHSIERRAKYLLLNFSHGTLILHLGMSGTLRILPPQTPIKKHDHFDLIMENGQCLRLNDPRRFGAVLWTAQPASQHPLIRDLGPEPLEEQFNGNHLHQISRKRKIAIKQFLMDNKVVVGVGNIYANESLFLCGVDPRRKASSITKSHCHQLATTIKTVLKEAIKQGGTTLSDFTQSDGKPGYFQQQLQVYGRTDQPCTHCHTPIKQITQGQRSSFFCPQCQN